MARSIADIQKQMLDYIAADAVLSVNLTSKSKRAIWLLWTFVFATCQSISEQIADVFQADVEASIDRGAPATPSWIQDKMLKFQYSATNPQIAQLINFAVQWPVVDETLRIITRCSVTGSLSGSVIVKVATGEPPAALSGPQIAAAQSYVNLFGAAGINYVVRSAVSDKLMIKADIFYSGLYSSVIQGNVIIALNNYLAAIDFDGKLKVSDIELVIRSVEGVTDVTLFDMVARPDGTAIADAYSSALVLNKATIGRLWPTIAGYIVQETTANYTFADTLNFISE